MKIDFIRELLIMKINQLTRERKIHDLSSHKWSSERHKGFSLVLFALYVSVLLTHFLSLSISLSRSVILTTRCTKFTSTGLVTQVEMKKMTHNKMKRVKLLCVSYFVTQSLSEWTIVPLRPQATHCSRREREQNRTATCNTNSVLCVCSALVLFILSFFSASSSAFTSRLRCFHLNGLNIFSSSHPPL